MIDQRVATEMRTAAASRRAVCRMLLEPLRAHGLDSLPAGGGAGELSEKPDADESVARRINKWDAEAPAVMNATEVRVDRRARRASREES